MTGPIIEAGDDYTERLEAIDLDVNTVEKAIESVADRGYRVMHDTEGGCNEFVDDDYIAITVFPK